ncbi:MAG: ATP-dependent metallopeptidase FtsH/Yme1/Tma family protein, partial [Blastomonas fulva]
MNDDQDPNTNQNGWMKNMLIWAGVIIGLLVVVSLIDTRGSADRGSSISYSTFRDRVSDGQVK